MDAQKFRDFVSDQVIKAAGGEIQLTQIKLVVLGEIAAQLAVLNRNFDEYMARLTKVKP